MLYYAAITGGTASPRATFVTPPSDNTEGYYAHVYFSRSAHSKISQAAGRHQLPIAQKRARGDYIALFKLSPAEMHVDIFIRAGRLFRMAAARRHLRRACLAAHSRRAG